MIRSKRNVQEKLTGGRTFSWYLLRPPFGCSLWRWSSCRGATRRSVTLVHVLVDGSCDLNTVLGVPENCNSPGNDVLWVENKTIGSKRVFSLNDTERDLDTVIGGLMISRWITQQWWCKCDKTPSCWAVLVSEIPLWASVSLCCAPCCCSCIFLPSSTSVLFYPLTISAVDVLGHLTFTKQWRTFCSAVI